MTITITLRPRQVSALQHALGADIDVAARMQEFCDDWCVQFERSHDDAQARELFTRRSKLDATKQASVDAILATATVSAKAKE
jgi:hypothetical protein